MIDYLNYFPFLTSRRLRWSAKYEYIKIGFHFFFFFFGLFLFVFQPNFIFFHLTKKQLPQRHTTFSFTRPESLLIGMKTTLTETKEAHHQKAHSSGGGRCDELIVVRLLAAGHEHTAIVDERGQRVDDSLVDEIHDDKTCCVFLCG